MDISHVIVLGVGVLLVLVAARKGFFTKAAWVSDDPIYAEIDEATDAEERAKLKHD